MAKKAGAKDAITLMGGCVKNQGLKGAIRMKKQSDFCKSVSCRECSDRVLFTIYMTNADSKLIEFIYDKLLHYHEMKKVEDHI